MKKLILILMILLLQACGRSKPINYYKIQAVYNNENEYNYKNKNIIIGINKVNIPEYLEKPQIITLKESNAEYNINDSNRYLEPLNITIQRTIIENINNIVNSKILAKKSISENENFNFFINLTINKFDIRLNDKVYIDCILLIKSNNKNIIFEKNIKITKKIDNTFTDVLEKQSDIIYEISNIIINNIV